jgi:hypothetical protein
MAVGSEALSDATAVSIHVHFRYARPRRSGTPPKIRLLAMVAAELRSRQSSTEPIQRRKSE